MTLKKLEAEKASIQSEIEPLLSSKSLGPTTLSYPPKLSTATNKIEDLNALTNLYGKKYVGFKVVAKKACAEFSSTIGIADSIYNMFLTMFLFKGPVLLCLWRTRLST